MDEASPIAFLAQAQEDPKLSTRVRAAVEQGGRVTADEVLAIAREFGYSFSQEELEDEVRRDMAERFKAGDESFSDVVSVKGPPLESSCNKGCLSYTKTWHPSTQ